MQNDKSNSEVHWKVLIVRARELREAGGSSAFERATILTTVFNDKQFRSDNGNLDDFSAVRLLDDCVDDLFVGFLELKRLLEFAPDGRRWAGGHLKRLHAEMLAADAATRRQIDAKRRGATDSAIAPAGQRQVSPEANWQPIESVATSEYQAALARIVELEAENRRLKSQLKQLREVLATVPV